VISPPVPLVGDEMLVPCIDGHERPYVASMQLRRRAHLDRWLDRVEEFLPSYRASTVAPATSPSLQPPRTRTRATRRARCGPPRS